ncbi:MAG: hypothetical protein J6S44_03340, partial [Clostridia bacterium]|nr:hypothetical protein [Clostridia bacterium]
MNELNHNPSDPATVTEANTTPAPKTDGVPSESVAIDQETTANTAPNGAKPSANMTIGESLRVLLAPYLSRVSKLWHKLRRPLLTLLGALTLLLTASLLFSPCCHYVLLSGGVPYGEKSFFTPAQVLFDSAENTIAAIFLICVLVFLSASVLHYGLSFRYFSHPARFARAMQRAAFLSCLGSGAYYVAGLSYAMLRNESENRSAVYSAGSLAPYIWSIVLLLAVALVAHGFAKPEEETESRTALAEAERKKNERRAFALRLEFAVYTLVTLAIAIVGSLSDLLHVTFSEPQGLDDITLNGWDILT